MELIAQIALGVIIGGLTIALLVTGFFVWNSRQRNERLAVGLFIAGAVIVVVLVVVVASMSQEHLVSQLGEEGQTSGAAHRVWALLPVPKLYRCGASACD